MSRRWRFITAVLSLCALLFTQTALAAHACEGPGKALAMAEMAEMAEAAMPCASSMSTPTQDEQAALCHAHCQSAQKSLDNPQPAVLASAAQLGAVLTVRPASTPGSTGLSIQAPLLRLSASPPLAISHCCLRI